MLMDPQETISETCETKYDIFIKQTVPESVDCSMPTILFRLPLAPFLTWYNFNPSMDK